MNIRGRGFLAAWVGAALLAAGCGGGYEVIPLADVPPPPDIKRDKSKDPKAPVPAHMRSPSKLTYGTE